MNLRGLVRRLGLAVVARRLGISTSTLKVWLERGPSTTGQKKVEAVAKRHAASKKAARTKKKRDEFQASIPVPPREDQIPPEKTLPRKPPTRRQVREFAEYLPAGERKKDTDRYIGNVYTFTIGRPVTEVDVDELSDFAVRQWQDTGRTLCLVNFLFFRYIPFNPLYKGELLKKQGKWFDWWTSTPALSTQTSISNAIENVFAGYDTYRDGRPFRVIGASEAAETRVIFLEQIQVHVFDDKTQLPDIESMTRRRLR